MKIIISKWFQVILYCYYLFQGKDGRFDENLAIGMLISFLSFMAYGIFVGVSAFIYSKWIGIIMGAISSFYFYFILYKELETGLTHKIIKKKPKIGNSNFLSIVFTILFTILSLAIFYTGLELAEKIEDSGIQLIK